MTPSHDWFTVQLPEYFSAWLWHTFRRPRRFLVIIVVVPLAMVVTVTHQVNILHARGQAVWHLAVTARLTATIIEETLETTSRFERILMARPGFVGAVRRGDAQQLIEHLEGFLPFVPRVDLAVVISPEGEVIAAYPGQRVRVGANVADDAVFRGAKSSGRPYVSAVYLSGDAGREKVIGVVQPILLGDTVIGFLQLQHRVREMESWLRGIQVWPGVDLHIVDHRSQLVMSSRQTSTGPPEVVADWPTVKIPLDSSGGTPDAAGGTLTYREPQDGARWLAGISPVGATGWRVIAVQPEGTALGSLTRVFWILSLLTGLLLLLVIAVSFRWAQLHAFTLRLLRQNAKLLRRLQQDRILERSPK